MTRTKKSPLVHEKDRPNDFEARSSDIVRLIRHRQYARARQAARRLFEDAASEPGYQARALMYRVECQLKQGDFVDVEPLTKEAVRLMLLGPSTLR